MLPKDDSQQNAELRQAFANHLPRRVELIQKRVQRLCKSAFDINALTLLIQECEHLAGASGRYGFVGPSERLFALEQRLQAHLAAANELDADERQALEALAKTLSLAPEAQVKVVRSVQDYVTAPPADALNARFAIAPSEYWRRFSALDVQPIDSESGFASLMPAPQGLQLQGKSDGSELAAGLAEKRRPTAPAMHSDIQIDDDFTEDDFTTSLSTAPRYSASNPDSSASSALVDPVDESTTIEPMEPIASPPDMMELDVETDFARNAETESAAAQSTSSTSSKGDVAPIRRALLWASASASTSRTQQFLRSSGYSIDSVDSFEELCDVLNQIAVSLVLLRPSERIDFEALGDYFVQLKQRAPQRCIVAAFAENSELTARIRALRAGVDILLPRDASDAELIARLQESNDLDSQTSYRILIIEDDRSQALFAESVLRKANMETCVVLDPLRTIEELERFRPDLILMDLYMPGIDGFELTAIVREREEFISTPIVFLSGEQDSDKQFDALSAGGDDFLSKPIRPKHLISAVTNRARRARALLSRKRSTLRKRSTTLTDRLDFLDQLSAALVVDSRSAMRGGLVFLEVDELFVLRQQLGIAGLDALMMQLGEQIGASCLEQEIATRYGDGSFALLSKLRSGEDLLDFAQQLRERLALGAFEVDGKSVQLTIYGGVCGFSDDLIDAKSMLNEAERAMLQARAEKRPEGVKRYAPVLRSPEQSDAERTAEAIRRALQDDGFQVLFQPIVGLNSAGEDQYELLLRLRVAPGQTLSGPPLLATANELTLSAEVDRWALQRCMAQLDERKRHGQPATRLFVDQSLASLRDPQRLSWMRQSIETRRINASGIALEFRMSDVMQDLRASIPFFQQARALGLKLVLDHFESSLSALQLLSYLPVDYLKLAPKYLEPGAGPLLEELKATIAAAHDGGRLVIASNVENTDAAASLWRLGVDYIQGSFVQMPGGDLSFDFTATAM